ncbi:MAG TPA: agmatinase, partial [Planctomycetota bacterium]|nr:agmatinase [Planctomycetota bacterium]
MSMSGAEMSTRPTFLGVGNAGINAYEKAFFHLLPVPYERTVVYGKGTRDGPMALIEASAHLEGLEEEFQIETWRNSGIHTLPSHASQTDPEAFLADLSAHIRKAWRPETFLFTVGGEHSVTEGPLRVVAERYSDLSVLQIDAHADLRDEYHGSRFNHACAARRMMEYAPVVQVGVRSVSVEEARYCNSERVRTFFMHKHRDVKALIPQVVDALSENVYISIDVDGLDPSVIPGVGTPVPGGLGWYETLDLLREVCRSKTVVAADLMELAPMRENHISEYTAARLVYKLMTYVTARRLGKLGE